VLAVEPRGLDSADEELRAVGAGAEWCVRVVHVEGAFSHLPGVGHGEDTGASVLEGEVLVLELLAVDGLATSALLPSAVAHCLPDVGGNVRCHG